MRGVRAANARAIRGLVGCGWTVAKSSYSASDHGGPVRCHSRQPSSEPYRTKRQDQYVTNVYYQDELRYLRDVGPEFARLNPEIARTLGDRGSDPDVERLLEGVAFLCGRIRQKLDDELPEVTASMMSLLWPHFLRPVPSMTILELLPDIEAMQAPLPVDPGAEFASVPVDGTRCRYRSTWPDTLRPWRIEEVRLETEAARPVQLVLRIRTAPKASLDQLELGSVRFHLAGDSRTSFTLYLLLCAHLEEVTVSDGSSSANRATFSLPTDRVCAAGLDRSDGVLPYPAHAFVGYRLLQEYFAFKERFLFFEVAGLDRAVEKLELEQVLEVRFTFNRRLDSLPVVTRDNVRLHCTPVVNLFAHSADPIRIKHDRTRYLIQPLKSGVADRRHLEVYSVDQVMGLLHTEGLESRRYEPFYSFRHMHTGDPRDATYYQTHLVPGIEAGKARPGTDTYMSFVVGGRANERPPEETISIELTCTNRDLPTGLRAGDIREPTDSSPASCSFRNLLKPTATISPPMGKTLHWRLISHMSLNYVSLAEADHFKELMRVYDFVSEQDAQLALAHQRLIDGIISVSAKFQERLIRGAAVRGTSIHVELDEDHFAGEGDAYLFATILDRFMALYSTLNAFTQLTVRFSRSGQVSDFKPRWGEQLTPAAGRTGV